MSKKGKNLESMEFWKAIEQMDFNGRGSKAAGRWLVEDSGLSIEQLKEIRNVANRKVPYIMRLLNDVTGVSDDAFSDVCWQILANGQEAYKNATVESTQEMIDNNEYTESFAYAFHEVDDAIEEAKQLSERNKQLEHIEQIRKTGGGFDQKLVAAFEHADNGNKGKLALVFPELFGHLVD